MKSHKKITKAVIALAGYGTRFLPAVKNQPKQMLPIIDKPIVQYLVEEAVASGIKDIILVTQAGQHILEDYFDSNPEIEEYLKKKGKKEYLKKVQEVSRLANFIYVRQRKHLPYGNGTPLLVAKNLIDDDESFVYMYGDDLTMSKTPVTKQLIDIYNEQNPTAIMAVQKVPKSEVYRYGIAKYKKNASYKYEIESFREKPSPEKAPSQMAGFGRFVFSYDMIREIEKTPLGQGGELWAPDAINRLAKRGKKVIAQPIEGEWVTTGDPLRYLQATVKFALRRKEYAKDFRKFLKKELK